MILVYIALITNTETINTKLDKILASVLYIKKRKVNANKKKTNPVDTEIFNIFSFLITLFAKTDFTPNLIAKIITPQ